MPEKRRRHARPMDGGQVLMAQLEANQALLLSALRASEQADDAHEARERAELEVSTLKVGEQELRTTAASRERLIGIIGHDLRTPLNTILIASGLLAARGALDAIDAELVARIASSCRRMVRMTGELADFTRVRLGGGFVLALAPADLGQICQELVAELRITTSVPLQQTARGNLCGLWDADRLLQALANVVSNAIDYAAPDTPVLIELREEGEGVAIEITNTGPCIPPELQPVIFTAFGSTETRAEARSGHLGLGLFVASEIAQAHGGALSVRSSDGSTTFTMCLPRSAANS